jgi:hypothetical protein
MTIQDNPVGLWWLLGTIVIISAILQSEAWLEQHVQGMIRWVIAV